MRSREELLYLNQKDITKEELENLSEMELNICDKCGEIDLSENLIWLEYTEFTDKEDIKTCESLLQKGYVAVDQSCFNNTKEPDIII